MPESDGSRKVLAALADASREGRAKCGTDEERWAPRVRISERFYAGDDLVAALMARCWN